MLVAVFSISLATAQKERKSPEKRAERLTEWMKKHLALTEAQVPTVQQINYKYAVKADSLRTSKSKKKEVGKQMISLNAQKDSELQGVLTAEQFATYSKAKKEKGEKGFKKGKGKNKDKKGKGKGKDKEKDKDDENESDEDVDLEESEE